MTIRKIIPILLCYVNLVLCNAQCISTGAHNGGAFTNITITGNAIWMNPSHVVTSNAVASAAGVNIGPNTSLETDLLCVQNFNFNVPLNAVICGIAVKLEKMQNGASPGFSTVVDNKVRLLKNGSMVGSNLAYNWPWTNYYSNIVYGGSSQTWGYSWTAADINSPNFGVGISATMQNGATPSTLSSLMDHVSITIFYTIPLPVEWGPVRTESINDSVVISWTTLSETNNYIFGIEKSADANHWTKVDSVMAVGNSNQTTSYEASDRYPSAGLTYYRISQTDMNGNRNYSDPVAHMSNHTSSSTIQYINGVIKFSPSMEGTGWLKCTNLYGLVLEQLDFTIPQALNDIELPISHFGPFVVTYQLNEEYGCMKLMGYQ